MIKINKEIIIISFFFIILLLLWQLSKVLFPFYVGIFLAYLLDPLVDKMEKRKINRGLSSALVLIFFTVCFFTIFLLVFPILIKQFNGFLVYFPNLINNTENIINQIIQYIQNNILNNYNDEIIISFKDPITVIFKKVFNKLMLSSMAIFNFLGFLIITPIVTWYILRDWDKIIKKIKKNIPIVNKRKLNKNINEIDNILSIYFRGQFLVSISLALYYIISFFVLDIEYFLFLGLLAGALSLLPVIGILISLILTLLLVFLQFYDYYYILYVLLIFAFAQLIESNILTPKIIGKKLGLHPIVVIFSIVIFGSLFGIFGIFFAIPVTAIITLYLIKTVEYLKK